MEEDRRMLASMLLGVEMTEAYDPERIARVAMEFGLVAGSSMDLANLQKLNLIAETSLFSQSQLVSIFGKPGSPLALYMIAVIIACVVIVLCVLIGIASYVYDKKILERANEYLVQHPSYKKD